MLAGLRCSKDISWFRAVIWEQSGCFWNEAVNAWQGEWSSTGHHDDNEIRSNNPSASMVNAIIG
jgi:hypothetical protein